MEQFVFIFRKGQRKLSEPEDKQRADEVRAWAMRQEAEGRELDPRILGQEVEIVQPATGSIPAGDSPVVAVVFLKAIDFAEAVKIAREHPGKRYDVSVEVRPWSLPAGAAAPAARAS